MASQTVSVETAAGGVFRLSGWIRTEAVTEGYAGFWARVDGLTRNLALDNMDGRGATGDTPWTRFEIDLPIDNCGTDVAYGAIHPGNGTAWFDAIEVALEGPSDRVPADCEALTQELNLEFERAALPRSRVPAVWLAESNFPGMQLDSAVRWSGRRSLRLQGDHDTVVTRVVAQVPLPRVAGRRVNLQGRVRSDGVAGSGGRLFLRIEGPDSTATHWAVESGADRGAEWRHPRLDIAVPPCAATAAIGVEARGQATVWFDAITVEIDSSGGSAIRLPRADEARDTSGVATFPSTPPVAVRDPCAPGENPLWTAWAQANVHPLHSLTSGRFDDLQFLHEILRGKRIVQLGESGHGVEHFNMVKTRFITFLHEEMGFNVLAFESSLEECYYANKRREGRAGTDLMRDCIFGVWHTEEVVALFEYAQSTLDTDRPLIIAGFDTQTSSRTSSARPDRLRGLIELVDPEYAAEVAAMDSAALLRMRGGNAETLAPIRDSLVTLYRGVDEYLARNAAVLTTAGADPSDVAVARQTTRSMIHLIDQRSSSGTARTVARDSGMAGALGFLADSLYPGEKIITWGHNFHLRHANHEVDPFPVKTTGAWLAERRRDELYTVGLYMYRGQAANNNRQVYDIARASGGSLESIFHNAGFRYAFLDLSRAPRSAGSAWVDQPITARTWGRSDVTMILRDQYDAILFIDAVRPPTYR